MMKIFTISTILSCLISLVALAQPSTLTVGNTTLDVRVVIQGSNSSNGIDIPWEIQWGPDNFIWMTERSGRVSRLNPETGARTTILDLSNAVYDQSEAGLLGLQLHPDFENNPYVFLAYTYSSGGVKERIVRYTYNSTSNTLGSPMILLDNINGNSTHIGCRLLILPDNTMLATTGDYQNQSSPQDDNALNGKILRMNLDGTIPSDNPFGPTSYVYSKGHRNAQGLLIAPNGTIYSSEHGPTTDDEFNIIVPGGNYGWPDVAGFCNSTSEMAACNTMTDYQDPLAIWYSGSTIAPSDIVYYNHPAIPEWQGKILMAVLKAEHIKVIELDNVDGTTVVDQEIMFNTAHANNPTSSFNQGLLNRLRDLCVAPDGRVFVATSGSSWSNTSPFTHSILELENSSYSPTSIENEQLAVRTRVYPNPTSGLTKISFASELVGADYVITDFTGRIIATEQITAANVTADFSALASGLYIIQSTNGNYTTSERLVISK